MRILQFTDEYFENQLRIFENYNKVYNIMKEIPNACLDKDHVVKFFEEKRKNNLRRGIEYTIFKGEKAVASFEFLSGQAASWLKRTQLGNSDLINKVVASHSMVSKEYQRKGLATFFHQLYLDNGFILAVNEHSIANIGIWDSLARNPNYVVHLYCPISETIYKYGQTTPWPRFSINLAMHRDTVNKFSQTVKYNWG